MVQRPLKGSRISSFYPVKTLPSLASLDSAFQLQEYISLLIRLDVHDVETIVSLPGKPSGDRQNSEEDKENLRDADKDARNEVVVDEQCWIYEQLRRLAQDLSHPLITMLQQECTRATCSEMKAAEWLYLCVAHGNDGAMEQCCAIDYILHTLDSATALLNSPRAFPSRLTIPEASRRHFPSLARRLGRIFAHAYFHHREAFEQAEAESSLYARFLALTSKFELVPSEFLVIPPRLSSVHDDSHERSLDIHDSEEPRRFLDSQRGSDRWGSMSDTGSAIDLALVDEEPLENHQDNAKKRWRSDTMVDRDTYLMGKKKREESLEKVFGGETLRATSDSPEPQILDIAAPGSVEPHIPISAPSPPKEEVELMKPPIFVPSQGPRPILDEPADPILEEPPIVPPPSVVSAVPPVEEAKEIPEIVEVPLEEPAASPAPADEEKPTEPAQSTADITSAAAEEKLEEVTPAVQSEEPSGTDVQEEPQPKEVSVKEEDVTEAEEEAEEEEVVVSHAQTEPEERQGVDKELARAEPEAKAGEGETLEPSPATESEVDEPAEPTSTTTAS
ncbi:Mob1/phocein [Cristinia sonorae]|uniref:Mob1/phocein n=1 Tax=Cristinia sonorae TaxID=1940300 RepID=A0A8K0UN39_9AGAR|nr:Mob1/phocein [Cristinia sonorae]